MDKYDILRLVQTKKQADVEKEEKVKAARLKLRSLVEKRIKTTMIGALAAIEDKLKEFWTPDDNKPLNTEQQKLFNLFQEIRANILDNGNNQIRLLENDIDNFNVEQRTYHLEFRKKGQE